MKKINYLLAGACAIALSTMSLKAQTVKFVEIDSTAAYFTNADSIAARKAKALEGLTNLADATPEFKKSMNEAASDKNFKIGQQLYYTKEFIEIPFDQYRKYSFDISGDWSDDTFVDIGYNKKVIVLRNSTPEERERKVGNLKGYFAPKTGTPMARNESEVNAFVGKIAPDFEVTTMDGKRLKISKLKGKVVVVNFWFTQCRPCIQEIPELNALVDKYAGNKDIVFIAPEVRKETTQSDIQKFLKRVPFKYQIALNGAQAAEAYQVKVFPANFLIDKEGKVQIGWVGLNPFSFEKMEAMIPTLLK